MPPLWGQGRRGLHCYQYIAPTGRMLETAFCLPILRPVGAIC